MELNLLLIKIISQVTISRNLRGLGWNLNPIVFQLRYNLFQYEHAVYTRYTFKEKFYGNLKKVFGSIEKFDDVVR